ncbi:unnamed protein product [Agarophyton chilense]
MSTPPAPPLPSPPLSPPPLHSPLATSPQLPPSTPYPARLPRTFHPSPLFTPSPALPPSTASTVPIVISASVPSAPTAAAPAAALLHQLTTLDHRLHAFLLSSRQQHVAIRRALHQAHVDLQSLRATHTVLRAEVEETASRVSRADDFLDRLRRDVQTALLAKRNTAVNRVRGLALHAFFALLSLTVRFVFFLGALVRRAWIAARRPSHHVANTSA